ncbi:YjcQ family protein [Sporanaerobacter sp. PP17-6a]|uniref:YjcQ family protein n=1 Tax=Sporanaerobacter sp. PP17-6a TaxID=1891289 RepID=UPI0008A06634|nr:YjcQ family protein [Sporanaerobacter sp. PP17-6a]SCL85076.1 YjcQ protein [Sporanaerobacter sp. PP17-6a]
MDNFKIIYKILKTLEKAMDYDEFDARLISAETLGVSQNRWEAIMVMLQDEGYIEGISYVKSMGMRGVKLIDLKITLKGLEYLEENSFMKKAANLAKGIADLIP